MPGFASSITTKAGREEASDDLVCDSDDSTERMILSRDPGSPGEVG